MKRILPALIVLFCISMNAAYARWPSLRWSYGPGDLSGRGGETVQDGVDDIDRRVDALEAGGGGETNFTKLVSEEYTAPDGVTLKLVSPTSGIEFYATNETLVTKFTAAGWSLLTNDLIFVDDITFAEGGANVLNALNSSQLGLEGPSDLFSSGNYIRLNNTGVIQIYGGTNAITSFVDIGPLTATGMVRIGNNTDWIEVFDDRINMRENDIDNVNRIGVGTDNPGFGIEVKDDTSNAAIMLDGFSGADSIVRMRENGVSRWVAGNEGGDDSYVISKGTMFGTDDYLVITSTGRVGVGTTAPTRRFQVNDNADSVISSRSGTSEGVIRISSGDIWMGAQSAGDDTVLQAGAAEAIRIQPDGDVGIGTTSPQDTLHVDGNAVFKIEGTNVIMRTQFVYQPTATSNGIYRAWWVDGSTVTNYQKILF